MNLFSVATIGVAASILGGCASERAPVSEEQLSSWFGFLDYSYVATAPERRIGIFRYSDGKVCMEPSPDAADQVASDRNAGVKVTVEKLPVVDGKVQETIATSIRQLTPRTQALQLYRDHAFHICNMSMSNKLSDPDVAKQMNKAFVDTIELLKVELPLFYASRAIEPDRTLPPAAVTKAAPSASDTSGTLPAGKPASQ